ncbi:Cas4 exonuclease [Microbacterium phage Huwbert]|nr:Cas4 exonuclease [Microbacterium phage Huwbert]
MTELARLESLMTPDNRGLYYDEELEKRIITHSMLKTFRRCEMCSYFKYILRLKPKLLKKPLKRGTWVHTLLEAQGNGEDWRALHKKFSAEFDQMFDEEKDYYGDMPTEIGRIMESYAWHYANDPWKYVANEFTLEAEFPDGTLYRGKVDALIENEYGLWLVDHKTHRSLPDLQFRLRDSQSALYLWAARENGLNVQGFIWNYLRWKAASKPKLVDRDRRLSDAACDTDYPTYVRALKEYKRDYPETFKIRPKDKDKALYLRGHQYEVGRPQTSEFFRRDILEKSDSMLDRVMMMNYRTALRMQNYDFDDINSIEMADPQQRGFFEDFEDLHVAHVMGGNVKQLIRLNYTVGDPNDYYQDRAGDTEGKAA